MSRREFFVSVTASPKVDTFIIHPAASILSTMSRRRKLTDTTPFDTLRLEGTLFVPELLERAARGEAAHQKEADYAIPKGLKLHDEYGRAYRIAAALWQDFAPQLPRTDLDPARATNAFVFDLLRQCLGFTDLTSLSAPVQIGDRGFPVTAQALGGRLPVIIAPHSLALDDPDPRFAILGSGARRKSAHQLAQEFLNASRDSLWAIVTNGRSLRLLRDAETLTRPNFLEFDLETILREGEARYADFSALWRILHASRSGTCQVPSSTPADCIWEKWKSEGHAQGLRVREGLRSGVTQALLILGRGFLTHPDNLALRQRLHDGTLTKEDYFQQLLRLIYRSLFLFCAEERDLLHTPAPASGPSVPSDPSVLSSHTAARKAYAEGFSLRRLRNRSLRQTAHDSHGDLWLSLRIVFRALASGQPRLALPALGGLFAETQCPDLDSAALANRDLLAAMRQLRWSSASGSLTAIDYRNMGPEELGSVYESLLELVPQLDLPARTFGFAGITDTASTSGNARKTTGSYYTPDSLVQELIKSALDPVIADRLAAQPDRPVEALLSITVCDPSCGSGHFLLAAARRLAEKLAELRAPDGAVRPDDYRHALREVASRCLYGVDINPMAVELCRVALWLETVDPGKPLGFLNHHIRTGNSLLGTTPDLIAAGLPDDTFTAIEGDDKTACAELKKRNKKEREGFGPLFEKEEQTIRDRLRLAATQIEAMDDSQPAALQQKEAAFTTSETAPEYRHAKLLADLWCAAFVIKKHYPPDETDSRPSSAPRTTIQPVEGQLLHTQDELFGLPPTAPEPPATGKAKSKAKPLKTENWKLKTPFGITTAHLRDFVQGKPLPADLQTEVEALARQYRFFHWHLAFPQVFDQGGFACILGNPPWERVKLAEKEWFAERSPEIASAANASLRQELIDSLISSDPKLYRQFLNAVRVAEGESHVLRSSGRYPLCARGDINLYAIFAEANRTLLNSTGRTGCVLPSGIATDETTKFYFQNLTESRSLVSLFDFENMDIFPSVHSSYKFCLFTAGSGQKPIAEASNFVFFAHKTEDLQEDERRFTLSSADIARLNPNTRTCPVFRFRNDAELTKAVYKRLVVAGAERKSGGWGIEYLLKLVDPTIHRGLLINKGQLQSSKNVGVPSANSTGGPLPLYEGKEIHQFDHRFGSFGQGDDCEGVQTTEKEQSDFTITPRYWLSEPDFAQRLKGRSVNYRGVLSVRDIARVTDERTVITAIRPLVPALNSVGNVFCEAARDAEFLCGCLNSFAADYIARQKIGGTHLSPFYFLQLAVVAPDTAASEAPWARATIREWIEARVLELTYTAWDLEAFAADCGWSGPPFRWDEERRFLLRCELDAAFFHLYLGPQSEWQQQPEALTRAFPTPRHAVSYIMDTFPIVKRKDETKHRHYRTKETILQIYDSLTEAMQSGTPYQTMLNPSPAAPECRHPKKKVGILAFGSLIGDPGPELAPKITMRIKCQTPFNVEYGRYSGKTRGGAPTLVPHKNGQQVSAEILVLEDAVSVAEARSMLWRRERRQEGTGQVYEEGTTPNSVLVREFSEDPRVASVLYTDFLDSGKIAEPAANDLAEKAIDSVRSAGEGKDGITYLMNNIAAGIETPLTKNYKAGILERTGTDSLPGALRKLKTT